MNQKKILYVENESGIRTDVAARLRREDFYVIEAEDVEQGLNSYHSASPDLVLCDVNVPKLSGLEFLQSIKTHDNSAQRVCPVIFLARSHDKNDYVTSKYLDCDDYLLKPVDFDVLLAAIYARLRRWDCVKKAADTQLHDFRINMLNICTNNQLKWWWRPLAIAI